MALGHAMAHDNHVSPMAEAPQNDATCWHWCNRYQSMQLLAGWLRSGLGVRSSTSPCLGPSCRGESIGISIIGVGSILDRNRQVLDGIVQRLESLETGKHVSSSFIQFLSPSSKLPSFSTAGRVRLSNAAVPRLKDMNLRPREGNIPLNALRAVDLCNSLGKMEPFKRWTAFNGRFSCEKCTFLYARTVIF